MTQEVPTHAWNHDDWVQEWQDDDSDDEAEEAQPSKTEDFKENDRKRSKTGDDSSDNGWGSARSSSSLSSTAGPRLPPRCPTTKTKRDHKPSPTIDITPSHPQAVNLDRVQDLSQVFEGIYTEQTTPRASERLAQIPRRDYLKFHRQGGAR